MSRGAQLGIEVDESRRANKYKIDSNAPFEAVFSDYEAELLHAAAQSFEDNRYVIEIVGRPGTMVQSEADKKRTTDQYSTGSVVPQKHVAVSVTNTGENYEPGDLEEFWSAFVTMEQRASEEQPAA